MGFSLELCLVCELVVGFFVDLLFRVFSFFMFGGLRELG